MIQKPFTILEAPSILGLFPKGVETLPDALLAAGLANRLDARRAGRVEPPLYNFQRDPETLLLNPRGIAHYSVALADAVGRLVNAGTSPVLLGGDCSIVLGCLLALKRRGRHGLLFLDGHADFYQPEAEPNGEAASMDLALATGHGPAIIADLEGRRPLMREEDIVVLGRRDAAEAELHGSQRVEDTAIEVIDLADIRKEGIAAATSRSIDRLSASALEGFWVHLDADVLNDTIMPAVDYRMPGGLSWDELSVVLCSAAASGRMIGINITIFNPKLDLDGMIARGFVDALGKGLSP
jgi:arginase